MNKLPKPKHRYGYPSSQLNRLLKIWKIPEKVFAQAFGVNTCAIDDKTGEIIYYVCDVERALYQLGHKLGRNHLWD